MKYLDDNADVSVWSYEKVVIEYISNARTKKLRKYYPDFLVIYRDGRTELIEIKPKRKLDQLIIKKKTSAATVWCEANGIIYKILTEIELKELGIL